jgi:hypothetical protein
MRSKILGFLEGTLSLASKIPSHSPFLSPSNDYTQGEYKLIAIGLSLGILFLPAGTLLARIPRKFSSSSLLQFDNSGLCTKLH